MCFLPWKTASVSHVDPWPHANIAACHSARVAVFEVPAQNLYWTFQFFFSRRERENMWLQRKSYLVAISRRQSKEGYLPPGIQVCHPCAWLRCGWGALTLQLSCPGPGPWVHCTYSETRKGVGKKHVISSKFQCSWTFELWALVSFLPVIHIIAKKILEVEEDRKSAWAMASMAQARRMWALFQHPLQFDRLEKSWLLGSKTQIVPATAFTRLLCPFPNSNCNYRDDKMENKYICSSWEKPISFAPVRNNAELLVFLTNWLSIYIVMYLHDPNVLRKSMTMKCMLEV